MFIGRKKLNGCIRFNPSEKAKYEAARVKCKTYGGPTADLTNVDYNTGAADLSEFLHDIGNKLINFCPFVSLR